MRRASIVVAAALTVAGINLAPASMAAPTTAPSVAHNAPTAASVDARIQSTLDGVTQAALTPASLTRLVSLFGDAQQQSITKSATYTQGYGDKLDAQINSFNKTWKQKYGNDFAISKASNVLSQDFASIKTQTPAPKSNGMESASVDLIGQSATRKLEIPLICEKNNDWRINVPSSLTAEKLRANLLTEVTAMNSQSAKWPTNEADAYRTVTDHVLMAILDKPATPTAQATVTPPKTVAKAAQPAPTATVVKPVSSSSSTHHWWQFW